MAVNTIRGMRQPAREATPAPSIWPVSAQTVMGLLFLVALLAFEIFNFDTTRFALIDFLGEASFAGIRWATVLAIAFCAIDFAGLLRFFLPQEDDGSMPPEIWYLMGAWLLGATMNALMTWWAINLTLLNHDFGNEVLSRQQLLEIVPIFVATLVWVTRILFIGAFTVAGGYLFNFNRLNAETASAVAAERRGSRPQAAPLVLRRKQMSQDDNRGAEPVALTPTTDELPSFLERWMEDDDEVSVDEAPLEQGNQRLLASWQSRTAQRSLARAGRED